jgi:hypothetical protein
VKKQNNPKEKPSGFSTSGENVDSDVMLFKIILDAVERQFGPSFWR